MQQKSTCLVDMQMYFCHVSAVFKYTILVVAETYFPGINSQSVSCCIGYCQEGCAGSVRGSGYSRF
jgi:hypothetical protein